MLSAFLYETWKTRLFLRKGKIFDKKKIVAYGSVWQKHLVVYPVFTTVYCLPCLLLSRNTFRVYDSNIMRLMDLGKEY